MLERKKMEREDENTGRSTVIHRSRSSPSQQASLGWLIFTWGVPLAHNHPPLSLSAKISKNTGISLYTEGRTERGEGREVISPKWYAHKPGPALSRTAPTISRHDLSRSRVRAVVDEGEESDGVDDERGRRREKIRRWRRRGTSARSRATIRDHLPCSTGSSSLPDPPRRRWRRGGGKSGVAPIIKLFTHTVRHLSSGPAILTCYYLILTLLAI